VTRGSSRSRHAPAVLVAVALLTGDVFAAPAPAPSTPRAELEGLQASVEAAVTGVSRPAGLMFGRPSRAYHLKGYGAIVVLAPRTLPRVRRHAANGPEARAFADLLGRLERSLQDVGDPEERRRLEEALAALRNGPPPGRSLRMRAPRPRLAAPPHDIASLQEDAEAFRQEAERAMEKAERDVLIQLRSEGGHPFILFMPPGAPEPPLPPDAALAGDVPAPPAPEAPPAAVAPVHPAPPAPPAPRVVAVPPPAPPAPVMPPGWPFWFGEADVEDAAPDRVLADVRRAIVAGLGAYRGALAVVGPDEFVVVAVDFVPRMADRDRSRTVVARARKRDLMDHRAGRLSADGLRSRVEFDEY